MESNLQSLSISLGIGGDSCTCIVVKRKQPDGKFFPETIEISGTALSISMNSSRDNRTGFYQVTPKSYYVGLMEAQAIKLIDYLASEGFLKQAKEPDKQKIPHRRPEWRNWIRLQVSLENGFLLHESLGWGPAKRRRFEGLRGALDGDAAMAIDEILCRLPKDET